MITILITVGSLPQERRGPVLAALEHNVANSLVRDIQIVTEVPEEESLNWLYEAVGFDSFRLNLIRVQNRPSFADMFHIANDLLASGTDTIALMNADISFASERDAQRMLNALITLDGRNAPVLLALTRNEAEGDRRWLGLYEPNGLPNTISADAWIFQKPIKIGRDLFYMPGQMNCDMMLAYDLINSGYRLFNPCLDIAILHHEPPKEHAYYEEKNENSEELQETIWRHAKLNKVAPWNYYGTPWLSSEWLRLGYKPLANSTHGRKLIISLSENAEQSLGNLLPELEELIQKFDVEVQILAAGDIDSLIRNHAAALAHQPRIWFAQSHFSLDETRRAFLAGKQYGAERIAFVSDISRVDQTLLAVADQVFLTVQAEPVSTLPQFGCTLVTSAFRSDAFIRGFVRNITGLAGYNRLVEHVFLISSLSETEIDVISKIQTSHPNVVVLWHRTDPGLYECWNIGIRIARTDYVSNANVDDLRHPQHIVTLLRILEARPYVAVAATALVPFYEYSEDGSLPEIEEIWYTNHAGKFGFMDLARLENSATPRLDPHNIPHCMPIWRRSLHDIFGWFDETLFGTYADWAFWLKVLGNGNIGWLDPKPLSFYYVNPSSHNRRGSKLEEFHGTIEATFGLSFTARLTGCLPQSNHLPSDTSRKLHLLGLGHSYGQHRNSFNSLIAALEPLNKGQGGVRFVPFLERQFVWGDCAEDYEASSINPRPITDPWIGILHVPFDTPDWFALDVNPKYFFETVLFQQSLPFCRGLITFSDVLRKDLAEYLPGVASLSLKHPTSLDVQMWDSKAYSECPCVIQVGDWLRKLQAIHRLKVKNHRKIMLLKKYTIAFMQKEIDIFGDYRDRRVEMLDLVSNQEYDNLLSRAVVLCLMYSTAANNIIIECIARATPILVNPLPGAVEYLGVDYPLYVENEFEASSILAKPNLVEMAHLYLLNRRVEIDLSYAGFCKSIGMSNLYKNL